jgi:hypothetical protein
VSRWYAKAVDREFADVEDAAFRQRDKLERNGRPSLAPALPQPQRRKQTRNTPTIAAIISSDYNHR